MQLIPNNISINFIKYKNITLIISIIIITISAFSILTQGINYGIDFKGGTLVEIRTLENIDITKLRSELSKIKNVEITKIQSIGTKKDFMIYLRNVL